MRTILHLSDLHFGRVDPTTLDPFVTAAREIRPDVVVISGDLTQRARRVQVPDQRATRPTQMAKLLREKERVAKRGRIRPAGLGGG